MNRRNESTDLEFLELSIALGTTYEINHYYFYYFHYSMTVNNNLISPKKEKTINDL